MINISDFKPEVSFSDGIKKYTEDFHKRIYPEELLDKKCGSCVRCEKRDHKFNGVGPGGYHCMAQPYDVDITPKDKACVHWWDKKEHERIEELNNNAEEERRKELWKIYSKKDPVKLPLVFDGCGPVPLCPICGEPPYSDTQCHWCGQKFVKTEEIEDYFEEDIKHMDCWQCGGKNTIEYVVSKYNGHKRGYCKSCGMSFME